VTTYFSIIPFQAKLSSTGAKKHSHSSFIFIIGHGYLAVWVLMFIMTDDGLFAIRLDCANKKYFIL
jgi:hypothetical protein